MIFVATILALSIAASVQTPERLDAPDRVAHWRQDLEFLVKGMSAKGTTVDLHYGISTRGQKDFDKLYPHFSADIESLEADLPKLPDAEVVLRIMKIMAGANVAHNTVWQPIGVGFFSRLPIEFTSYSDGLAVMAASSDYERALGTHVLKLADKTPDQVFAGLAPYFPHETDQWLRGQGVGMLRPEPVLSHLGLMNSDGQLVLTLQKPGGEPFTLAVRPSDSRTKRNQAYDELHVPMTLARSHPDERFYWHQYLADSQTLYIQYNECANDPKLKFSDFAHDVFADTDSHKVARVVVDLRRNGGGDSRVIGPLKGGLEDRTNKVGRVFVLIGANTFSSGIDNAIELQHSLHATLVGEPTGGLPNSYGQVKYLTLPNSKLKVQFTSAWFGKHGDSEPLKPDLLVQRKLEDVLAGRDAVLDAVLSAN